MVKNSDVSRDEVMNPMVGHIAQAGSLCVCVRKGRARPVPIMMSGRRREGVAANVSVKPNKKVSSHAEIEHLDMIISPDDYPRRYGV